MHYFVNAAQTGPPATRLGLIAPTPQEVYLLLALLPLQVMLIKCIAWRRLLRVQRGLAREWGLLAGLMFSLGVSVLLIGRLVSRSLYCF